MYFSTTQATQTMLDLEDLLQDSTRYLDYTHLGAAADRVPRLLKVAHTSADPLAQRQLERIMIQLQDLYERALHLLPARWASVRVKH